MTLEERAKEAAKKEFGKVDYPSLVQPWICGYAKGATEQREIDIRIMRQWLEREYAYNGSMAVISPEMIDEICKAMEEKSNGNDSQILR